MPHPLGEVADDLPRGPAIAKGLDRLPCALDPALEARVGAVALGEGRGREDDVGPLRRTAGEGLMDGEEFYFFKRLRELSLGIGSTWFSPSMRTALILPSSIAESISR